MSALSKLAEPAIRSVADFIKSFSDKTFYHASVNPDIKEFNPNSPRSNVDGDVVEEEPRGATYFTTSPDYANKILEAQITNSRFKQPQSEGGGSTIYPVKLKLNYIFDPDNVEDLERLRYAYGPKYYDREIGFTHDYQEGFLNTDEHALKTWATLEDEGVQDALKDAGFRGYLVADEPGTVGLFYPGEGDVRSIFAKFDPAKSKSGEILASVPAATLTGYGALEAINGQSSD